MRTNTIGNLEIYNVKFGEIHVVILIDMSQDPSHHCIDPLTTSIPLNKSINLQSAAINSTKHWPTVVISLMVSENVVLKSAKKIVVSLSHFFLVSIKVIQTP